MNANMQKQDRPFTKVTEALKKAGLRTTRQRLAIGKYLFSENRHVTAEQLYEEIAKENTNLTLATVYNTLHQFAEAGLIRELTVESGRSYFDSNTSDHHHYFFVGEQRVEDIPSDQLEITKLPDPPPGKKIAEVVVLVRLEDADE